MLRDSITIEHSDSARIEEETLSDGSKVYNVFILTDDGILAELPCRSLDSAIQLFSAINDHTVL